MSIDTTIEKVKKFTKQQDKAVNTLEGVVCLSAGPGCGKTFVLVNRYINIVKTLISEGLSIEDALSSILAVTFTNKAAHEMQERVRKELLKLDIEKNKLNDIDVERLMLKTNISTIDSWAMNLLRETAFDIGIDPSFTLVQPVMARVIFLKQAKKYFNTKTIEDIELDISLDTFLHEVFNYIGYLKCRLIDAHSFLVSSLKYGREDKIARIIKDLYLAYEITLSNNNQMDFSNLLFYVDLVSHTSPEILKKNTKNIRYLLIDEYQDINNAQDRVLRMIGSTSKKNDKENYFCEGLYGLS